VTDQYLHRRNIRLLIVDIYFLYYGFRLLLVKESLVVNNWLDEKYRASRSNRQVPQTLPKKHQNMKKVVARQYRNKLLRRYEYAVDSVMDLF
jgi:hypothetical protein